VGLWEGVRELAQATAQQDQRAADHTKLHKLPDDAPSQCSVATDQCGTHATCLGSWRGSR
jgi:hypothetical protein